MTRKIRFEQNRWRSEMKKYIKEFAREADCELLAAQRVIAAGWLPRNADAELVVKAYHENIPTARVEKYVVHQPAVAKTSGCEGCMYWKLLSWDGDKACHYMLMEGLRRDCPPGAYCTKRKPPRKNRNG